MTENKQSFKDFFSLVSQIKNKDFSKNPDEITDIFSEMSKEFNKLEFSIHGIDFRIKKIHAWYSWILFDKIRVAVGKTEASGDKFNMTDILKVPHSFIHDVLLKEYFFNYIEIGFKGKDTGEKSWLSFSDHVNDDAVGEKMEAIDFYELLLRSFFVNFTKSAQSIMGKMQRKLSRLMKPIL